MKLLLDENLSDRIVAQVADLYPGSTHVKTLGLTNTDDAVIWEYAQSQDLMIVSKDADFHQRSLLYGHPPKFVYLRVGNCPTSRIVALLRSSVDIIQQFADSATESVLVLA